jgi:hypothetical protein
MNRPSDGSDVALKLPLVVALFSNHPLFSPQPAAGSMGCAQSTRVEEVGGAGSVGGALTAHEKLLARNAEMAAVSESSSVVVPCDAG